MFLPFNVLLFYLIGPGEQILSDVVSVFLTYSIKIFFFVMAYSNENPNACERTYLEAM